MLLPLEIPPGMFRSGTDLQSVGRWREGNLVRWRGGALQPVGGWEIGAAEPMGNPPRGAHVWRANDASRYVAAGTADGLFVVNAARSVLDITPADLVAGGVDAVVPTGYGRGAYGSGLYGGLALDTGTLDDAASWSLDNWGENLVACSDADGRLLEWNLVPTDEAAPISNSPIDCVGLVVTEERILMALGADGNPRKVQWSDQEDNTAWSPSPTNQAGALELTTRGRIMCARRVRGQVLILTDQDAHTATYQGPPFVYGFERVGINCGVFSRMALATVDSGAYWMGPAGFFRYAGGAVEPVACEVLDFVLGDINRTQASKIWSVEQGGFGEIWWFYPSSEGIEVDSYVALSVTEGHWSTGRLARTAGVPDGVFRFPIWFDAAGQAYDHEFGANLHGGVAFVRSGPVQLGIGDRVLSAVRLLPDERTQGETIATFTTRFHPNNVARTYGPYPMAAPTSVRFTGRQVEVQITGAPMTAWRVGIPRLEVRAGGAR